MSVLHIGPSEGPGGESASSAMDSLLEGCGLSVERRPDVYRALAYLVGKREQLPSVVVVCMDYVGSPELEFFTLVARLHPERKVYVYGGGHTDKRIEQLVQSGAADRASKEVIRSLSEGVVGSPGAEPEDAGPAPDDSSVGSVEKESVAVRVPWRRYDDAPARIRPSGFSVSAEAEDGRAIEDAQASELEDEADSSDGPLLSPAELRGLMGEGEPFGVDETLDQDDVGKSVQEGEQP